ncbi:MAG: glycosyltransferase family 2 protein [Candidatus Diapherotrites archaeon]
MVFGVSLVVPCYNEETIIEKSVLKIQKVFEKKGYNYEILLIDDKSKDFTKQIIQRLSKTNPRIKSMFHSQNQGRGQTVKDGINVSKHNIVGFIDIDLEIAAEYLPKAIEQIQKGFDVCIGVRHYQRGLRTLHRAILSKGYSFMSRAILNLPLKDTESGLKFFNKKTTMKILKETQNKHWFWDTEIMALAYYSGLKISEIDVIFEKNYESPSTVNIFSDSFDYFNELIKFRKRIKKK